MIVLKKFSQFQKKGRELTMQKGMVPTFTTEEVSEKFKELVLQDDPEKIFCYIKELINMEVVPEEIFKHIDRYYYSLPGDNRNFKKALIRLRDDGILYEIFDISDSIVARKVIDAYINKSDRLDLGYGNLTELPKEIGMLHNLKTLVLKFNQLTTLPDYICGLHQLRSLEVEFNRLTELPESIGQLQQLEELKLWDNQITRLPESIGQLQRLQRLSLWFNRLTTLPDSIGNLQQLQNLDLKFNQITVLPESIGGLQSLRVLNLRENQITVLPESIGRLEELRELHLGWNYLINLPESIGQLQQLEELNLRNNLIIILPESIGQLQQLQNLDLQRNYLMTVPESMGDLQQIQSIDLEGNRFTHERTEFIRDLLGYTEARVNINVYEQEPIIYNNTSLPLQIKSLKEIASGCGIIKEWPNAEVWERIPKNRMAEGFGIFLDKVWDTKDAQDDEMGLQIMLNTLMNIFAKMEMNSEYRQACFSLAEEAITSCADRTAMGLIQMQLAYKGYCGQRENLSIQDLFKYEKTMIMADKIFNIAREKVKGLQSASEEIETYLKYFKELKDDLGIDIEKMTYERLSNVSSEDIEYAREMLNEITDGQILERLVDNPTIKKMFEKEFEEIQNRPEFDTTFLEGETDAGQKEYMENMGKAFIQEKINLLKSRIYNVQYFTIDPIEDTENKPHLVVDQTAPVQSERTNQYRLPERRSSHSAIGPSFEL